MSEEIVNLAEFTRYHARERSAHTAIVFEGKNISYGALDESSNKVANALLANGIAAQDKVAVLSENSENFFEILFGTAKINATLVPVNCRLAPPEVEYILADAAAQILFLSQDLLPLFEKIKTSLHHLKAVILLPATSMQDNASEYTQWRDQHSGDDPLAVIAEDDIAVQLYTSGTTGRPKGVMISHRAIISMRRMESAVGMEWIDWQPIDVVNVSMPLFHIAGSFWALQFMYCGATCILHRQVTVDDIFDAVRNQGATRLFVVPAVLKMMLDDDACVDIDFGSLKTVSYGGSPIAPDTLKRAMSVMRCDFVQIYGMTETCGTMTFLAPADHDPQNPQRLKSCGRLFPQVKMKIMDENGNEVSQGAVGEVCVQTPALMTGYWNLPEATAEARYGDWFRTGDAGYLDESNYLYLVDRVKDMIISGGENVYPTEVENAIMDHPSVADVAVIGVADEKWGEAVKAIAISRDPALTYSELKSFLSEKIAGYKIPKSIELVQELPRNPAGKILRKELREQYR